MNGLQITVTDSVEEVLSKPWLARNWLRSLAQAGAQLFYGLAGAMACESFQNNGVQFLQLSSLEMALWKSQINQVKNQFLQNLRNKGYPALEMLKDIEMLEAKYQSWTSDQLMQASIDHPFTNLLPQ